MSQLTQHGQHPDADQLTAFVEHALPPHEREQTLAHLATCADCRAIVALSLPPVEESPAPRPEPVRRPWFTSWHLVWPTAAAFAALTFVIIHLHTATPRNNIAAPTEIATSQPSAPPSAPSPPPASTTKSEPSLAAKRELPDQIATGSPKTSTHDIKAKGEGVPNLPLANRSYTAYVTPPSAPTAGAANNQQAMANATPAPPPTQQRTLSATSPQPNLSAASKTPLPSYSQSQAAAAAGPPAPAAIGRYAPTIAATNNINGFNVDPNTSPTRFVSIPPLPSRLPTLSTAVNGHQVLAIDTQNTLFYSEDDGRHWAPIPSQWQGRAVRVNVTRPTASLQQDAIATTTNSRATLNSPIAVATPTSAPSVTGTITDASGAVIPNASITISNPTTRTTRTATSDRNGHYLIDTLTPGNYQLEATSPGFQKQQLPISIAASQQNQTNLTLTVGSVSEAVTVDAAAQAIPLAAPRALKKSIQPKPPPTLFEITTNNGDHWTSTDGKTWTKE